MSEILEITMPIKTVSEAIKLTLPLPPSANRYWRKGRNGNLHISAEASAYKDEIFWQNRPVILLDGDLVISLKIYRKQKSGDLDNRLKVLLDALQGVVYENDSQIVEIHAYRFDDAKNPRVEVEIWQAE